MKVGSLIWSRETRTTARIVNFDDESVIAEVVELPKWRSNPHEIGEVFTIKRRGNRWLKVWEEQS